MRNTILTMTVVLLLLTSGYLVGINYGATNKANTNSTIKNSKSQFNQEKYSSTSFLDEFNEPHLTVSQTAQILADIQNPNQFFNTTDYSLVGDCGESAKVTALRKIDAQRKVQVINESYPIVRTPNPEQWSTEQAKTFMDDSTLVCGVGFFTPFSATDEAVLWRVGCSSGMVPTDVNGKPTREIVQCIQAQEVISIAYHQED